MAKYITDKKSPQKTLCLSVLKQAFLDLKSNDLKDLETSVYFFENRISDFYCYFCGLDPEVVYDKYRKAKISLDLGG